MASPNFKELGLKMGTRMKIKTIQKQLKSLISDEDSDGMTETRAETSERNVVEIPIKRNTPYPKVRIKKF